MRWVFYGEQAQDELIEQRENGGVCADADGERGDRDRGEKRIAAKLARAVANVSPESFEPIYGSRFVAIFVMDGQIPELAARGCDRVFARHALREVAFGELLEVLANFVVGFEILSLSRFLLAEEATEFCGERAESRDHDFSPSVCTVWPTTTSLL
jgi:hypothetical protein